MIFQKRFNELEDFHKYVTPFNEMYKFVVDNGENFNDVYDEFKKEHGLKNLYFSRLADLGYTDDRDVDVCYRIVRSPSCKMNGLLMMFLTSFIWT